MCIPDHKLFAIYGYLLSYFHLLTDLKIPSTCQTIAAAFRKFYKPVHSSVLYDNRSISLYRYGSYKAPLITKQGKDGGSFYHSRSKSLRKAHLSNTCQYQLFTLRYGQELQYCSKAMSFLVLKTNLLQNTYTTNSSNLFCLLTYKSQFQAGF